MWGRYALKKMAVNPLFPLVVSTVESKKKSEKEKRKSACEKEAHDEAGVCHVCYKERTEKEVWLWGGVAGY